MPFESIPTGKGRKIKDGKDLAILTIGTTGNTAMEAIAEVEKSGKASIAHYDLRFVKPLDEALLDEVAANHTRIITIEDGALRGGVGEAIAAYLNTKGHKTMVRSLGIKDKFIEHGTVAELQALCGYDKQGVINAIQEML